MLNLFRYLLLFPCFLHFDSVGQTTPETKVISLNNQWLYFENNTHNLTDVKNAAAWQAVNLPHTWNAQDTVDVVPGYRRSGSWYKRTIDSSLVNSDGLTHIYFEGANFETRLYVNGGFVGEHIGGYVGFSFDLTPHLRLDQDNELLVRVSNQYNPDLIPSQKSDFFLYGGITRDVWIHHLPEEHIVRAAITTPTVSHEQASTVVSVDFMTKSTDSGSLKAILFDPAGHEVAIAEETINPQVGQNKATVNLGDITSPLLWSPDSPHLYTVKVILRLNDKNVHSHSEVIGYRWFEMKPHKGFFLNGQRLLIRGTHRHEEHAGYGSAVPNELHRQDMQMIKDLGANFVRLGHYPQDPEVYKAANELGLIIWDELPWCRGGKGGKEWERNTEHLLTTMIQQNYNHPSIIFWSLGNEMYWEEDFPNGGATTVINPYLEKLNTITKSLDPYRLTTLRKYYPGASIVDAFSPSIWAGWYGGAYGQYREALQKAMADYPAFLHMEYGGSSHVGRHTETPVTSQGLLDAQVSVEEALNQAVVKSVAKDTDWNENYIVDLFDWHLNISEKLENFAGNAQWAFKDFGTPLRPENPIPYMNMKGLVDREGHPKDAYYVFASYWKKAPFCWIESHTWTHRSGPKDGRDVTVYCNTQSAELFLNGETLGVKEKKLGIVPAGGLLWKVPFQQGKNHLKVIGFDNQNIVAENALTVTYHVGNHGRFSHISLTNRPLASGNYLVEAEALDSAGNRVLTYSERANFFNIGEEGQLLENYGTPRKSSTIEMANGYAAIEFMPGKEASIIEFRTQNIKGVYVNVPAISESR